MEMVINAVMLLHLECANPIDSLRHGGCQANRDQRRSRRPPVPSLRSPSSLGPRAGVRRARGVSAGLREVGSRSDALRTPDSPPSASQAVPRDRLARGTPRAPHTHLPHSRCLP